MNEFNIFKIFERIAFFGDFCRPAVISVLEITQGCCEISKVSDSAVLISAFVGFGGICVHCQVFSILSKVKVSYFKFLIARLAHGAIASFFTFLMTKDIKIQPFNDFPAEMKLSAHIFGSLALFLCCVYLLYLRFSDRCNDEILI
jgi:nucleoside recognition membrane protein YjiH